MRNTTDMTNKTNTTDTKDTIDETDKKTDIVTGEEKAPPERQTEQKTIGTSSLQEMTRKGAKGRKVVTNMVIIGETIESDIPAVQGVMSHRLIKKPRQEIRIQENKSASMNEKQSKTHAVNIRGKRRL